jgi:hypothetical protein
MTFRSLGFFASSGGVAAAPGMVLMNPTSIAYSGTSATLGANGQVTFSAVTSLSLNGCFTADFDNYVVSWGLTTFTAIDNVRARLRSAGSDASGSNYTRQYLIADSTTVAAARGTSQTSAVVAFFDNTTPTGYVNYIYGPFLAQPTAFRSVGHSGYSGSYLQDDANTHSLSTSYDGITFFAASGNLTGKLQVYGVRS